MALQAILLWDRLLILKPNVEEDSSPSTDVGTWGTAGEEGAFYLVEDGHRATTFRPTFNTYLQPWLPVAEGRLRADVACRAGESLSDGRSSSGSSKSWRGRRLVEDDDVLVEFERNLKEAEAQHDFILELSDDDDEDKDGGTGDQRRQQQRTAGRVGDGQSASGGIVEYEMVLLEALLSTVIDRLDRYRAEPTPGQPDHAKRPIHHHLLLLTCWRRAACVVVGQGGGGVLSPHAAAPQAAGRVQDLPHQAPGKRRLALPLVSLLGTGSSATAG